VWSGCGVGVVWGVFTFKKKSHQNLVLFFSFFFLNVFSYQGERFFFSTKEPKIELVERK